MLTDKLISEKPVFDVSYDEPRSQSNDALNKILATGCAIILCINGVIFFTIYYTSRTKP